MAITRIMEAAIVVSLLIGLSGCGTPKKQLMNMETSQVDLRIIQSRAFDTTDEKKTLRTVISALQDFDFLIDEANRVLGVVSARKTHFKYKHLDTGKHPLLITVTVRPRRESQLLVRANIEYNKRAVEDPSVYQKFFTVLEKSMFLTAHEVD